MPEETPESAVPVHTKDRIKVYAVYALTVVAGFVIVQCAFDYCSRTMLSPKTAALPKPHVAAPVAPTHAPAPASIETPPAGIPAVRPVALPTASTTVAPVAVQPPVAPSVAPVPAAATAPAKPVIEPLSLQGVFIGGEDRYALINNRIVRTGDKIKGARINKIELQSVELDYEGTIVLLQVGK